MNSSHAVLSKQSGSSAQRRGQCHWVSSKLWRSGAFHVHVGRLDKELLICILAGSMTCGSNIAYMFSLVEPWHLSDWRAFEYSLMRTSMITALYVCRLFL